MTNEQIRLDKLMFKGTRYVYQHPEDDNKCIKIDIKGKKIPFYKKISLNNRVRYSKLDLQNYLEIKGKIYTYLPKYDEELIDTNLGSGVSIELIRDYDNKLSKNLTQFVEEHKEIPPKLIDEIKEFLNILIKEKIHLFDFNMNNFLLQKVNEQGNYKLYFIDCKSLNLSLSLIPIDKIQFFAKRKMQRRAERFMKYLTKF